MSEQQQVEDPEILKLLLKQNIATATAVRDRINMLHSQIELVKQQRKLVQVALIEQRRHAHQKATFRLDDAAYGMHTSLAHRYELPVPPAEAVRAREKIEAAFPSPFKRTSWTPMFQKSLIQIVRELVLYKLNLQKQQQNQRRIISSSSDNNDSEDEGDVTKVIENFTLEDWEVVADKIRVIHSRGKMQNSLDWVIPHGAACKLQFFFLVHEMRHTHQEFMKVNRQQQELLLQQQQNEQALTTSSSSSSSSALEAKEQEEQEEFALFQMLSGAFFNNNIAQQHEQEQEGKRNKSKKSRRGRQNDEEEDDDDDDNEDDDDGDDDNNNDNNNQASSSSSSSAATTSVVPLFLRTTGTFVKTSRSLTSSESDAAKSIIIIQDKEQEKKKKKLLLKMNKNKKDQDENNHNDDEDEDENDNNQQNTNKENDAEKLLPWNKFDSSKSNSQTQNPTLTALERAVMVANAREAKNHGAGSWDPTEISLLRFLLTMPSTDSSLSTFDAFRKQTTNPFRNSSGLLHKIRTLTDASDSWTTNNTLSLTHCDEPVSAIFQAVRFMTHPLPSSRNDDDIPVLQDQEEEKEEKQTIKQEKKKSKKHRKKKSNQNNNQDEEEDNDEDEEDQQKKKKRNFGEEIGKVFVSKDKFILEEVLPVLTFLLRSGIYRRRCYEYGPRGNSLALQRDMNRSEASSLLSFTVLNELCSVKSVLPGITQCF